jgi:putative SOS response-associated peptidase YedK
MQGSKALLTNARVETAPKQPIFRRAFAERRCLVPADGFYEWTGPKKARRPIWFHAPDRSLLLFAGLYAETEEQGGLRFLVLTRDSTGPVASVHDRMPVVLAVDEAARWLAAPDPQIEKHAVGVELLGTEVSTRVSSVKNDDPECLAPQRSEQLRLF